MIATASALHSRERLNRGHAGAEAPRGLGLVMAAEVVSSLVGFATLSVLARRLGPASFSHVEYAATAAAWLLVLARGGFDVVVYREAARKPRLIASLTDLLVGLRLSAAGVGLLIAVLLSRAIGAPRGLLVVLACLILVGSAFSADVWPRATGRLGWLAALPIVRSLGHFVGVLLLVRGPGDGVCAVLCLVAGEFLSSLIALRLHRIHYRRVLPRWRRLASRRLARRGLRTAWIRLARVSLFGLDMLALGAFEGPRIGEYAAARRVVFALVGFGILLPGTLGPAIAKAWDAGLARASDRIDWIADALWSIALPASVGLIMTSDRTMPFLFGPAFNEGGPWLALIAARLPWLLSATLAQTTLIACRREERCGWLMTWQLVIGSLAVTLGVRWGGPAGAGLAALAIEFGGFLAGWITLRSLGIPVRVAFPAFPPVIGAVALVVACRRAQAFPLPLTFLSGALTYAIVWWVARRVAPSCRD